MTALRREEIRFEDCYISDASLPELHELTDTQRVAAAVVFIRQIRNVQMIPEIQHAANMIADHAETLAAAEAPFIHIEPPSEEAKSHTHGAADGLRPARVLAAMRAGWSKFLNWGARSNDTLAGDAIGGVSLFALLFVFLFVAGVYQ